MDEFAKLRENMVESQLKNRGIHDPGVLAAMKKIPRHEFVPESLKKNAYEDHPLPIGFGQTISQPFIVAKMAEAAKLTPECKVLEIGTGSGYNAAVLSALAKEVYTLERIELLAGLAKERLAAYPNVIVALSDGTMGYSKESPYDVIIVTAGAPSVPESLLEQLKVNGRLVIPVGDELTQRLVRYTKKEDGTFETTLLDFVRFVPLIGQEGWTF